ncbi:MAG: hypothetical protein U0174_25340 [Polyangiaceae bacterium]
MDRRAALVDEETSPGETPWVFNPDADYPQGTYVLTRYITTSPFAGGRRRMTVRFEGGCVRSIVDRDGVVDSRSEWYAWDKKFSGSGGFAVSQLVCPSPAPRTTELFFAVKRFQDEEFLTIRQGHNYMEFTKVE